MPPPFVTPAPTPKPLTIFTIGHSNVPADDFLGLLHLHHVTIVLDVRSSPYSRFVPHFNRESLQALLVKNAFVYEWAGDSLGGRPVDPTCYLSGEIGGKLDHAAVRKRPWYQRGLHDLMTSTLEQRLALLCSEEDPRRCHRHHLVSRSLLDMGVQVLHIRHTGELEDAELIDYTEQDPGSQQLNLEGIAV